MRSYTGYSDDFRRVVEEMTRDMSLREIGSVTGVSHTAVDDLRRFGKVPHYAIVEKLADGVGASPNQRAELFIAAGYREEEKNEVRRLIAGLRDAGYDVPDAEYLRPATVDAILAAVGNTGR